MVKLICSDCGGEMEFNDLRVADVDLKNGELYIEENYECSGCDCRETFGFTGTVNSVERWGKR